MSKCEKCGNPFLFQEVKGECFNCNFCLPINMNFGKKDVQLLIERIQKLDKQREKLISELKAVLKIGGW